MVTTAAPASVSRLESLRGTNTPARMRIAAGGTAILAIVMAFVGSTAFGSRAATLEGARDSAAQLGQIEAIRTGIVEADALASTSYLRAGLEAPEERARYTALIADAQAQIVTTARGGTGSDVTTLGKVSDSLAAYIALVEQSRANIRQGFPVGAAYQREASSLVRDEILPELDALTASGAQRTAEAIDDDMGAILGLWLPVVAVFAAIVVGSIWLYRRTRRILNVGLVVAGVVVAGVAFYGTAVLANGTRVGQDVLDGSYSAGAWLALARTAGFDAKSNQSLTLIARGNGAAFEQRWQGQAESVDQALATAEELGSAEAGTARQHWEAQRSRHETIRQLDDTGQYDAAVSLAINPTVDANGAPTTDDFGSFDDQTAKGLAAENRATVDDLNDAASRTGRARWVVLVGGLLVAVAVLLGYGRRIREYR